MDYEEYEDTLHPDIEFEVDEDGNVHISHLPKDLEPLAEALGWKREWWWGSPCG